MTPVKTTVLAVLIVAIGLIVSVRLGNASPLFGRQAAIEVICRALVVAAEPGFGPVSLAGYPCRSELCPARR